MSETEGKIFHLMVDYSIVQNFWDWAGVATWVRGPNNLNELFYRREF